MFVQLYIYIINQKYHLDIALYITTNSQNTTTHLKVNAEAEDEEEDESFTNTEESVGIYLNKC